MGLEPMTSPLPRECSTTELHQPYCSTLELLRNSLWAEAQSYGYISLTTSGAKALWVYCFHWHG